MAHIHVPKLGEADDAEAFLETFQGAAEVSSWPRQEWAHRLLPLLTGEAKLAAHSLPAGAQRDYDTVAKAIQIRLSLNPEEHRPLHRCPVSSPRSRRGVQYPGGDTAGYVPGAFGFGLHADHDPSAPGAVRGIGGGI